MILFGSCPSFDSLFLLLTVSRERSYFRSFLSKYLVFGNQWSGEARLCWQWCWQNDVRIFLHVLEYPLPWEHCVRECFLHVGRSFIYANAKRVQIIWEPLSVTMLPEQRWGRTWWILFVLDDPTFIQLSAYHTKRDPCFKKSDWKFFSN